MFFVISLLLLSQQFTSIKCELIKDPSLKPFENFVKSADAEILKKELCDDAFTDRNKIAKILFHRSLDQRIQISNFYNGYFTYINECGQRVYTTTLYDDLINISTDSLLNLYALIFDTFDAQLAKTLHEAISSKYREGKVVEEIDCANDIEIKNQIEKYYETNYQCKVEDHLKLFHKDNPAYQEAIHKYCWQPRCQEKKLKPEDVDKEVKSLQDIAPKTDKEGFKKKLKELLDKYCEPDLKEIFNKYKKGDYRISDGVDEAFDGDEKTAFNALVRYIENTCMFYADELYHAVHGTGTDTDKINRIVLTRSERDLACVLREFENKRHKSFTKRLKEDTCGEPRYLECIRYLCGKP